MRRVARHSLPADDGPLVERRVVRSMSAVPPAGEEPPPLDLLSSAPEVLEPALAALAADLELPLPVPEAFDPAVLLLDEPAPDEPEVCLLADLDPDVTATAVEDEAEPGCGTIVQTQ